ncbi:CBS domain-containing protein [Desulforhopalus singaporensis]|uniref:CBS domain-containing protein n=1 Tax=Desulforhopalus singaporensis TaxID=91360 RepID=A0A1H0TSF5_9BACT|nr:CBS domain-containing protein [Desulforhopalus singaporensis]SDP56725.1 CBS domain-containing protein [Desulforhopalus singaporensis]
MKVKDILAAKGTRVITVEQSTKVFDAMSIFSANRVGSLLVVDKNDAIVGIIAARDVLMAVVNDHENIKNLTVDKVMTSELIVGTEDDDIDYIQAIMTENRIRHVPIISDHKLKGLVSIGDVVKSQLKEKDVENKYLKDYIADKYPG